MFSLLFLFFFFLISLFYLLSCYFLCLFCYLLCYPILFPTVFCFMYFFSFCSSFFSVYMSFILCLSLCYLAHLSVFFMPVPSLFSLWAQLLSLPPAKEGHEIWHPNDVNGESLMFAVLHREQTWWIKENSAGPCNMSWAVSLLLCVIFHTVAPVERPWS